MSTSSTHNAPPLAQAGQAEAVWQQFKAVLETLAPQTRAAFLLHDVFATPYQDIGALLGLPADACQQLVEDARDAALARMPHGDLR